MIILAIETSCDETAISVVKFSGGKTKPKTTVLSHLISSQAKLHAEWGGVVPMLAKREHMKNFTPLLVEALTQAKLLKQNKTNPPTGGETISPATKNKIQKILDREPELFAELIKVLNTTKIPKIDAIAVTSGPGLEPALWVGINAAKALAIAWQKPLVPVNHMAGHIYAVLANAKNKIAFPAVALLVSGGHTELVQIKDYLKHKIIGQTRDDAVGEAFDKVARLLDLPYPGGPEISRLAKDHQVLRENLAQTGEASRATFQQKSMRVLEEQLGDLKLPRPMIHSGDLDFSFSGLKTAVLYLTKKLKEENNWNDQIKAAIAHEFQAAAVEVLVYKTLKALEKTKAKTLIVGGGVVANTELRKVLTEKVTAKFPTVNLLLSDTTLATDNATMIAIAGYLSMTTKSASRRIPPLAKIKAQGNLVLK